MWRIFALPGGQSLDTFLTNFVELRACELRRIPVLLTLLAQ
jgi:hypothetical protein